MRLRDEDKVKLVKEKALETIVNDGLEGFSMNKLAKSCGISVATLYIYYKDKDDLVMSIAQEEGDKMSNTFLQNFDPSLSFEEGLRIQWQNRYAYNLANPLAHSFFEQLRSSAYQERFLGSFKLKFKALIGEFTHNIVARGEINPMPFEVFWSIAYAPLYSLIRFDKEGQNIAGKPFKMSDEVLWQTFDLVIKSLKK